MHTLSPGIQSKFAAPALTLTLVVFWLLVRGYHGLTGDAQLYAQAHSGLLPSRIGAA